MDMSLFQTHEEAPGGEIANHQIRRRFPRRIIRMKTQLFTPSGAARFDLVNLTPGRNQVWCEYSAIVSFLQRFSLEMFSLIDQNFVVIFMMFLYQKKRQVGFFPLSNQGTESLGSTFFGISCLSLTPPPQSRSSTFNSTTGRWMSGHERVRGKHGTRGATSTKVLKALNKQRERERELSWGYRFRITVLATGQPNISWHGQPSYYIKPYTIL